MSLVSKTTSALGVACARPAVPTAALCATFFRSRLPKVATTYAARAFSTRPRSRPFTRPSIQQMTPRRSYMIPCECRMRIRASRMAHTADGCCWKPLDMRTSLRSEQHCATTTQGHDAGATTGGLLGSAQLSMDQEWAISKAETALKHVYDNDGITTAYGEAMRGHVNPKQLAEAAEKLVSISNGAAKDDQETLSMVVCCGVVLALIGWSYMWMSKDNELREKNRELSSKDRELSSNDMELSRKDHELDGLQREVDRLQTERWRL
jgi:hypothetical protein